MRFKLVIQGFSLSTVGLIVLLNVKYITYDWPTTLFRHSQIAKAGIFKILLSGTAFMSVENYMPNRMFRQRY